MRRLVLFLIGIIWAQASPAFAQTSNAGMTPCGSGISLSVTNTSSNSVLSACGATAVIWNIGGTEVFLNLGTTSSTTAVAATGWSLPPGSSITFNTGKAPLYLAAITASSTSTIRVVQGNGDPAISGPAGSVTISGTVTVAGSVSNASSAVATSSNNLGAVSYNYGFNGTTWDQFQVDSNKNLLVSSGGAPNLTASARVAVTSSNTSVAASRVGRRNITITNITGSAAIDCSGGGTATLTTGQFIPGVVGASWTTSTTAQISCISEGATQTVAVAETY